MRAMLFLLASCALLTGCETAPVQQITQDFKSLFESPKGEAELNAGIRSYEDGNYTAAMQQLQGWADTYFNAGLVELFIQAIGIFPVGTLVELSTGELAVVLEQSRPRRLKPKVLVVSAPDKTPLGVPFVLDLLHGEGVSADRLPYIRQGLSTASFAVDPTEYYLSRS